MTTNNKKPEKKFEIYGGYIYAARDRQSFMRPVIFISHQGREKATQELINDAHVQFPALQGYTDHRADLAPYSQIWNVPGLTAEGAEDFLTCVLYEMLTGEAASPEALGMIPPSVLATVIDHFRPKPENGPDSPETGIPVGVVMRPEYYARLVAESNPGNNALALGLPIYYDLHQEEPWRAFYNIDELKAYLTRVN